MTLAHIRYRQWRVKVRNCCDHHAKQPERSLVFPSKCSTLPNCKTTSIWISSTGPHRMCSPLVSATASICGVHAQVKWVQLFHCLSHHFFNSVLSSCTFIRSHDSVIYQTTAITSPASRGVSEAITWQLEHIMAMSPSGMCRRISK